MPHFCASRARPRSSVRQFCGRERNSARAAGDQTTIRLGIVQDRCSGLASQPELAQDLLVRNPFTARDGRVSFIQRSGFFR
jgi:hypothetical protein